MTGSLEVMTGSTSGGKIKKAEQVPSSCNLLIIRSLLTPKQLQTNQSHDKCFQVV
jgi:hypothetical protein